MDGRGVWKRRGVFFSIFSSYFSIFNVGHFYTLLWPGGSSDLGIAGIRSTNDHVPIALSIVRTNCVNDHHNMIVLLNV